MSGVMRCFPVVLALLWLTTLAAAQEVADTAGPGPIPYGQIQAEPLAVAYQGTETLRYAISYTGGITLGHLALAVRAVDAEAEIVDIQAFISTEGSVFDAIYPIKDTHLTRVQGEKRLPVFYEVDQKEGWGYTAHRLTEYDQLGGRIAYRRNDEPLSIFEVVPPVHNEFSAFFASRVMDFVPNSSFLVPTFADKRRSEVEVRIMARETLRDTVLGSVDTLKVSPLLKFKGLYDKKGDTVIWYTADVCRVPVRIHSKIAIGSITATLVSYRNPLCSLYSAADDSGNGH